MDDGDCVSKSGCTAPAKTVPQKVSRIAALATVRRRFANLILTSHLTIEGFAGAAVKPDKTCGDIWRRKLSFNPVIFGASCVILASPVAGMRTEVDVTELLTHWRNGDSAALDILIAVIYEELHRLAHRRMACERPGHALQTTALIHEAYLRLVKIDGMGFENRAHFFAACSEVMRRVLVDIARTRSRQRRGGAVPHLPLDEAASIPTCDDSVLIALEEALTELANIDPRRARVVELKFYGGLTAEEISMVLGISVETAHRDWKFSKAWLARQMDRRRAGIG